MQSSTNNTTMDMGRGLHICTLKTWEMLNIKLLNDVWAPKISQLTEYSFQKAVTQVCFLKLPIRNHTDANERVPSKTA